MNTKTTPQPVGMILFTGFTLGLNTALALYVAVAIDPIKGATYAVVTLAVGVFARTMFRMGA